MGRPTVIRHWSPLPPPGQDWDRPFAGLHHAALTVPRSTGTRAEHSADMLGVPRRVHANKLHAALSALFCRTSAGTLPSGRSVALLAAKEKRQTEAHQDGRALARQPIMTEHDARTDAALARLVSTLPTNAAQLLLGQLDEPLAERELLWHNVLSGTEDAMQGPPSPPLRHARGITPDDGDGDDEHPLARKRLSGAASDARE